VENDLRASFEPLRRVAEAWRATPQDRSLTDALDSNISNNLNIIRWSLTEAFVPKETLADLEFLILLAILQVGDEAYGVPIAREIRRRAGRSVARAAIYVTLRRLEEHGLVSSWFGDPVAERGGKARRYYRIEPEGREMVRATRDALRSMWEGLDPVLEKM
jgi:DNA-binding PadR family transcriptional regulator